MWTLTGAPRQDGRVAIVTGANTGIGFEVARALSGLGATVVLACRDRARAEAARIRLPDPDRAETVRVDLASLASVRAAAAELRERFARVDLLIANAGVLHRTPGSTEDGFEIHFGTNHLGHFALTGLVLDRLLATPGSRVVTVGSSSHRRAHIPFDDLAAPRRGLRAYAQSKLACLLSTYELQHRLTAAGAPTITAVGDPGSARTEVLRHTRLRLAHRPALAPLTAWIMQPAAKAALGPLRAALDPHVTGGDHFAPRGLFHYIGTPAPRRSSAASYDRELQRRLWALSTELTGVEHPV